MSTKGKFVPYLNWYKHWAAAVSPQVITGYHYFLPQTRLPSQTQKITALRPVPNYEGVQKVRRLTQLTTRYAHHILSLCNIDTCNWNAHGPAFLHHSDTVVEELLFLVFQPAICSAIRTQMANTVGDRVVQSRHFGWQPVLELTCDQMHCPGSKWLLFFPKLKEFMKRHKIFWRRGRYLHGMWLARRPRTTILLQRDKSFGETLDQAHLSCRCLCWKVTKYDVRIL